MTLTLEQMRKDVAELIDLDPSEVGDDDMLPDLGLDSLRLMRLVMVWEEAGLKADFELVTEYATLGEWWREVVQPAQAG